MGKAFGVGAIALVPVGNAVFMHHLGLNGASVGSHSKTLSVWCSSPRA